MSIDKTPASKPPILTNTFGLNAPKTERAGVGARNLQEIRKSLAVKPRLGDYNNSNNRNPNAC